MNQFRSILFVTRGVADDTEALKQALSTARNSQASLRTLIISPALPDAMSDYRPKYEAMLKEQFQRSVIAARDTVKISETELPMEVDIEFGSTPSVRIIRHVLRDAHDLVVKAAEPTDSERGFRAIDMDLLRKSPCPVWLSRPIGRHRDAIRVAVAIDPEDSAEESRDLALRLLTLSRGLADTCDGELSIISCWDYEFEDFLRNNAWASMPEIEVAATVASAQGRHRAALEDLVKAAKIRGKIWFHHERGRPDVMIPKTVARLETDILVMGTVSRTGIPGFIIGNTAENVVSKLACSLIALKPNGFVSPVKAY